MEIHRKGKKEPENIYAGMGDRELFQELKNALLYSKTGINLEDLLAGNNPDRFIKEVNTYIERIYKVAGERLKRFDDYILRYIFGFHVLTELMQEKDVTDIKVLAWDNVRVKRLGKREGTKVTFWSKEDFRSFVEMIAVKNGINTGTLNAIQTFTDKKSSKDFIFRFNITNSYINSTDEPYLHIRKIPKVKESLEKLIGYKMLTAENANYLVRRRTAGFMVICGTNGSGKTYLLNALLDKIPENEGVLVVQENEELFSDIHPDMMFQHIAGRKGDKKVSYSLKELVINGLLTDIDDIIIGEIKGEEAVYFVTAALSGCLGIATLHSNDCRGALDKLVDYCKWGSDYSRDEVMKLISCIKTIVYVDDFQVKEIAECNGWDAEKKEIPLKIVYSKRNEVDIPC